MAAGVYVKQKLRLKTQTKLKMQIRVNHFKRMKKKRRPVRPVRLQEDREEGRLVLFDNERYVHCVSRRKVLSSITPSARFCLRITSTSPAIRR